MVFFISSSTIEYALAALHDKIYAARLAYNSKTATELKREAATIQEKTRAAGELPRAASAALAAAVKEHTPAGATPLERARALATARLWAETWDRGATWHYEGD